MGPGDTGRPKLTERELRAALTPHAMSSGGMGGGYGSPAVQAALCYVDELAWQQALWTFAQGRAAYREAYDLASRPPTPPRR